MDDPILVAEDSDEDFLLTREALARCAFDGPVPRVEDGQQLQDYLRRKGRWSDPRVSPAPRLVLLDLDMPRCDGRRALARLKSDPILRSIPVVVLSGSAAPEDVRLAYEIGANAFLRKPLEFERFVRALRATHAFWFGSVELPAGELDAARPTPG